MGFAVVDVETTGLNPRTDRILEIGIVTADGSGRPTGEWSSLVNPGRPVAATVVHGLTDADVADAPPIAEVLPRVTALLAWKVVVAHNAAFDVGFLNAAYRHAGVDFAIPREATACTMELSKIYLPPGRHSLAASARRAGVPVPARHRALADARVAALLLRRYIAEEAAGTRFARRAVSRNGTVTLPASWVDAVRASADLAWAAV